VRLVASPEELPVEIYIDDNGYAALVAVLANLEPCPVEGRITEDQVKLALGEHGNVWPVAILSDALERR
jgi:hypothetical protein